MNTLERDNHGNLEQWWGFKCQQCGDVEYLGDGDTLWREDYDDPEHGNKYSRPEDYYRLRPSLNPGRVGRLYFDENEIICLECDEKEKNYRKFIGSPGWDIHYKNWRDNSYISKQRNALYTPYALKIQPIYRGFVGRNFANKRRRARKTLRNSTLLIRKNLYKPGGAMYRKIMKNTAVGRTAAEAVAEAAAAAAGAAMAAREIHLQTLTLYQSDHANSKIRKEKLVGGRRSRKKTKKRKRKKKH